MFWVNFAVCFLFGTFGVSQAESDRPIKALENTSPLAFTEIEEKPLICGTGRIAVRSLGPRALRADDLLLSRPGEIDNLSSMGAGIR